MTTRTKLTPAQRKVLEAMRDGATLYVAEYKGLFAVDALLRWPERDVSADDADTLYQAGFLEQSTSGKQSVFMGRFGISERGRAALEE